MAKITEIFVINGENIVRISRKIEKIVRFFRYSPSCEGSEAGGGTVHSTVGGQMCQSSALDYQSSLWRVEKLIPNLLLLSDSFNTQRGKI